jgi:hypothetical protein
MNASCLKPVSQSQQFKPIRAVPAVRAGAVPRSAGGGFWKTLLRCLAMAQA